MRVYAARTELVTSSGSHLRFIPGAMARAMVNAGHAEVANQNGRVKSIRLIATAMDFARRIREPTPGWNSTPFVVRERLGGGFVWRHHPRCRDYE
jgi:hypothetical protein